MTTFLEEATKRCIINRGRDPLLCSFANGVHWEDQGHAIVHTMPGPMVKLVKKLAHCEDGMYYCPACNKDLNGLESAMEHVRATSYAHESQCMLAGPYVLKGIGEIEPYIEPKACRMAMVRCKYCDELVRVGEWVSHVKESCTKLPCAFCLPTLLSAATCLGRQLFTIDQLNTGAMHFDDIFEPVAVAVVVGKQATAAKAFSTGHGSKWQHVSERTASRERVPSPL